MKYSSKLPARGDVVIDCDRIINKKGRIVSGVSDATLVPDVMEQAYVVFSAARHAWYSTEELHKYWVEEEQCYIINAEEVA